MAISVQLIKICSTCFSLHRK